MRNLSKGIPRPSPHLSPGLKKAAMAAVLLAVLAVLSLASPAKALWDDSPWGGGGGFNESARVRLGEISTMAAASDRIHLVTGTAVTPGLAILAQAVLARLSIGHGKPIPWYASNAFIIAVGAVLLLFALKDAIPFEPVHKLLAALEEGAMQFWGLAGLLLTVPVLELLQPASAMAAQGPPEASAAAGILGLLAVLAGTVTYAVVWFVSNSINVMILIAPALAAPVLKAIRLAIAGSLLALQAIHPALGLAASLLVIVMALLVAGWSFRLTVWGASFAFDLVFRRWRRRSRLAPGRPIPAFAGGAAGKLLGLPKRTLGKLRRLGDGRLIFSYRRFMMFARSKEISGEVIVGRRLMSPVLAAYDQAGRLRELMVFRLSLKGHEDAAAWALGASRVETLGLLKGGAKAWAWLRSLVSRREPELVAATHPAGPPQNPWPPQPPWRP